MRILADENIPVVDAFFADQGSIRRLPGRAIDRAAPTWPNAPMGWSAPVRLRRKAASSLRGSYTARHSVASAQTGSQPGLSCRPASQVSGSTSCRLTRSAMPRQAQ